MRLRGGEGAAGLGGFLGEQPGCFRCCEQAAVDLVTIQDAAAGQAIQADAGLVEGVVAVAAWCLGDRSEFLLEGGAPVGVTGVLLVEPRRGRWLLLPDRIIQGVRDALCVLTLTRTRP
jgi:hypothetical protein